MRKGYLWYIVAHKCMSSRAVDLSECCALPVFVWSLLSPVDLAPYSRMRVVYQVHPDAQASVGLEKPLCFIETV